MAGHRTYVDRVEAGRDLAEHLPAQPRGVVVLGLPRGGVVVAAEVARALAAPLDALAVRKVRLAHHPELALGAVASGGLVVRNEDVIADLRIPAHRLDAAIAEAVAELERSEARWRPASSTPLPIAGRAVILVDDGIATGATIRAAAAAVRQGGAARVVIAAPVAPRSVVEGLRCDADVVVVPVTPTYFGAVSRWYADFREVTDAEVRALLEPAPGIGPSRTP